MFKRRMKAGLVVLALAAASGMAFASSASAVTFPNACKNNVVAANHQVDVDITAATSPNPVSPGGTVTLSSVSQTVPNLPTEVFVAFYNLGLLQVGTNNVPVNVQMRIEATNAVELTQLTNQVGGSPPDGSLTVSTTITDPDGIPGTGDETATTGSLSVTYDDQTWTAGGGGTIDFRQDSIATAPPTAANNTLLINLLLGGFFNVQLRCAPGTVSGPDPGEITLIDPAPTFASTENLVQGVPTARAGPDQTVASGALVSLDGTTSSDPDSDPLTYDWTQVSGPIVTLSGANTATPTFTAPAVDVPTTLEFQLEVCDPGPLCNADIVAITVNPPPPSTISVDDVAVTEGDSGVTAATFTVSLSAPQAAPVTVDIATADGTAIAPGDYTSTSGTVSFAPGVTSQPVTVQVNGDTAVEPDETFFVNLSSAAGNATIADAQGVGRIVNDDAVAGGSTVSNACANSVTANFSQIEVTTAGSDGLNFATPGQALTTSGLSQSAAIPGAIFVAGYNLGLLTVGVNNIPANVNTKIEGTNTTQGTQTTNTVGGTPPNGSVSVTTTITDPDGTPGTGDETATDASFSVTYNNLNWTAGAIGTINYRQESIATSPPTAANNTLLINALIAGFLNVQFRCAPGTVTPPDPGTITLIDPAPSFDTTFIDAFAPVANAGPDQTVVPGALVTLDGTASTDGDLPNDTLTYSWTQLSGTPVTLSDPSSATPTFTSPDGAGILEFQLEVCDQASQCSTDTVVTAQCLGPLTISIDDQAVAEGGAANFTVSLDGCGASSQPVTVDFATSDGTAIAPFDYTSNSGTVTFAPGVTSQTVTVQTSPDALVEATETFNVNLSNATNAVILDGLGVGTILDVPPPQLVAVEVIVSGPVKAGATSKNYVLRVSNLGTLPVTVNPTADISADVLVNGVVNGSVTSQTGTKTISPGSRVRFRLRWTGDPLPAGATVEFTACLNLPGDIDPSDNCASATRIAG
jgi:Calx-beta domain/K319L-like, PKD domain